MLLATLLHGLFLSGLLALAFLVWKPRLISEKWLFVVAAGVWLLGVGAVTVALHARGPVWLAYVDRVPHFAPSLSKAPIGKHHKVISPPLQLRVPTEFDGINFPVQMDVTLRLSPDGGVSQVEVTKPSGHEALDSAMLAKVRTWTFGPLPPDYPDPRGELVKFHMANRYQMLRPNWLLFVFLPLFFVLWFFAVRLAPNSTRNVRGEEVESVRGLPRRAVVIAGFLALCGWLIIYRLAPDMGLGFMDMPVKQAMAMVISLAVMMAFAAILRRFTNAEPAIGLIRYRYPATEPVLDKLGWIWVIAGVFLLILTKYRGTDHGTGEYLWLKLGPLGEFQTVELVKVLMVLFVAGAAYTAAYAGAKQIRASQSSILRLRSWRERYTGILGAFILVGGTLVFMKDFGPVLLLFWLLIGLLFVQGHRRQSVGGILVLIVLLGGGYLIHKPPRWHDRVTICLNPWRTEKDDSLNVREGREQMSRALWGAASGGLRGAGLGQGQPESIQVVESDFLFVAIAEETGWLGSAAILTLLLYLIVACLRLAAQRTDAFEQVFTAGVGILLGVQSAIILGGNLGLWPLTGITLPFMSYGGSSLLMNFLAIGMVSGIAGRKQTTTKQLPPAMGGWVALLIGRTQIAFAAVFLLILLQLGRLQSPWVQSPAATSKLLRIDGSQLSNPRLGDTGFVPAHLTRGQILTRDGQPLAVTTPQGRLYPHAPDYTSIVGFETAAAQPQRVGIERFLNGPLTGEWKSGNVPATGLDRRGYDVTLTLDSKLQALASRLLRQHGYTGCIVGIDPRTGEVLCAANSSRATPPGDAANANVAAWQASYDNKPGAAPLAYRRLYEPGSTFKTLVAAAALQTKTVTPDQDFTCTGAYHPGHGKDIRDLERRHDPNFKGHGAITLADALAVSCNSTYANVGVRLGWDRLYDFADLAGFNRFIPLIPSDLRGDRKTWFETPMSMVTPGGGLISDMPAKEKDRVFLAQTALGERNVRMTPLHLALWTAAIANGGQMMTPSVVRGISDSGGHSVWQFHPSVMSETMSPATARELTSMMVGVVENGTGKDGRVRGMRVAGKTGTPEETVTDTTNAVFIAFAPAENPRLAVAVVIEGRKFGGRTAGPIAAELFRAMGK